MSTPTVELCAEALEPMNKKKHKRKEPSSVRSVTLKSLGQAKVTYAPQPPRAPEGKQIHARRPLPVVPEKRELPESDEEDNGEP